MPQTIEVRFKGIRRDFFSWPAESEPLRPREAVIVEVERGQDLGRVHTTGAAAEKKCGGCTSCTATDASPEPDGAAAGRPGDLSGEAGADGADTPALAAGIESPSQPVDEPAAKTPGRQAAEFRPVIRRATEEEVRAADLLRRSEEDARRQAMEKVRQHRLEMKLSDAEWQWDRGKLTFYFTAEKRVDFRALVRDLAAMFRTRIELRQIGVRDEAARLTGVGRCGREYCCSTWLKELSPVSLALAKDQHLSLNPAQISGGCGRLLCCLKYEHEFYVAARKRFPREGKSLATGRGTERVVAVDIFRERVFLRNEDGSRIIPLLQLQEEMQAAGAPEGSPARRVGGSREEVGRQVRGAGIVPRAPETAPGAGQAEPSSRRTAEPPREPPGRPTAEPARRSRRHRRGRRRGRGPDGGPSSPPSPPEA
jgi:cell fate regulator YaaT (PSP1 superfamily)